MTELTREELLSTLKEARALLVEMQKFSKRTQELEAALVAYANPGNWSRCSFNPPERSDNPSFAPWDIADAALRPLVVVTATEPEPIAEPWQMNLTVRDLIWLPVERRLELLKLAVGVGPNRCMECNGSGELPHESGNEAWTSYCCPSCNGSGKKGGAE